MKPLTTAIIARNAEATIERALRSVMVCGNDWPILLVDDSDCDGMADIARRVAGDQITIVKPTEHIGTGNARQTAMEHIITPYGMWLDADDELMPNRLPDMLARLEQGEVDLVYDGAILMDEATGKKIKDLPIPDFMLEKDGIYRNLERNWLPTLFGGFRTDFAFEIGYDRDFLACEDYDFFLRSILQGANVGYLDSLNVKYYHSENSVSRNMERTAHFNQKCYEKYDFSDLKKTLKCSVLTEVEQQWILASACIYAGQQKDALLYLEKILDSNEVIVTYRRSIYWLCRYMTASVMMTQEEWQRALSELQSIQKSNSADVYNNIGVCHAEMSSSKEAQACFHKALKEFPVYHNAKVNLQASESSELIYTIHPLRVLETRNEYDINK